MAQANSHSRTRSRGRPAGSAAPPPDSAAHRGVIRIVVVAAHRAVRDPVEGPPPISVETAAGLARLGDPVELLRAETPEEVAAIVADPSVDLLLLDRLTPDECVRLLEVIPAAGPPSVVVVSGDSDDEALAAFRAGASDCVQFGSEYERVLPVVLLEQVRRWRDVRQQRLSEQRIRWLEDLYAAIVSEMPAGLVVVDGDGLIVAVNPEFDELFPSRVASRAGQTGVDVAPAETPPTESLETRVPIELLEAVQRVQREDDDRGGHALELVRVDGPGGEVRAYEVRRRSLGDTGRVLLLISDVTQSEWLSERLEALRRDTRDIIENINSALIVVDLRGCITFANLAAEQILGGEGGDLGGREVADWFGHRGGDESEEEDPIRRCLEDGTRSRGAEAMLQRADGQWIPIGVSCSPRLDAAGRSRGAVAVFQDLSGIKQLELQVRQAEKMASIGQLAAGVAHEVNNPMGFIHANLRQMSEYLGDLNKYFEAADRLQQTIGEGDLEVIRAAAADVSAVSREIDLDYVRSDFEKALLESGEGAERIRHIVKDLRDFSRADLPERTRSDLNQAVDSTANIVYTMMKHSVHFEKSYAQLPQIDAYPMQLKQVFMNLLVNAHQAIEAREEREPGVIRIETEQVGDEVVVRIGDTGIGIAEGDRSRIFEPFFTTKPVGSGTGLGLSTCFNIIERHGGRIVVESEVGRGSTFEVWLPLATKKDPGAVTGFAPARGGAIGS